MSVLSSEQ